MASTARFIQSNVTYIHTDDFIEDGPTVDTQYTPRGHLMQVVDAEDAEVNSSRQGGQAIGLIASIEDRYVSKSGTPTNHSTGGNGRDEWPLASHPAIAHITSFPTHNDYPLWRLRCKVTCVVSFVFYT